MPVVTPRTPHGPSPQVDKVVSVETRRVLTATTAHYASELWRSKEALSYVRQMRGLSGRTVRHLKIGYAPGNTLAQAMLTQGISAEQLVEVGLYAFRMGERFAGYITLPVLDGEDTVYIQARAPSKQTRQKHESLPERLAHKQPMVLGQPVRGTLLTEGAFDFATLIEWQLHHAFRCAGLLGTAYRMVLDLLADKLQSPVILTLDQDNAGKRAALAIAQQLAERSRLTARIPVDMDRVALAEAQIAQLSSVGITLNDEVTRQWRAAQDHVRLAHDITAQGFAIPVRWAACKDVNELHMRGRDLAGRVCFVKMLNRIGCEMELVRRSDERQQLCLSCLHHGGLNHRRFGLVK